MDQKTYNVSVYTQETQLWTTTATGTTTEDAYAGIHPIICARSEVMDAKAAGTGVFVTVTEMNGTDTQTFTV